MNGPEATLLIKSSTLTLKYFLRLKRFRLVLFRISESWLAYGVQLEDDPKHPATLWSLLEYEDEVRAFLTLTEHPKCFVFLFNELAVNVTWGEVNIDFSDLFSRNFIQRSSLHPTEDTNAVAEVSARIDALHLDNFYQDNSRVVRTLEVPEWHPLENYYIANRISRSLISMFETNEGDQQEEIALWLIDNLQPTGAVKSPQVHESSRARELSDLLISYNYGAFLIESKTLAILARATLPNREKLTQGVTKHLQKATKQLIGGVKNLRRGHRVTDLEDNEIEVERTNPTHVIVLVPDLSLLANVTEFGGDFIRKASLECGGIFHILDPSELLRVVQAAEMISASSTTLTKIMAFDYYLMERAKRAVISRTPNFGILFRNRDDAETSPVET
jgi:hypothetical protein